VDKLAHKWDSKLAQLERLQVALKETPRHNVKRLAKLKQRIQELQREVAGLQVGGCGGWVGGCLLSIDA
jgi:cell division protein FtsB